MPEGCRGREGDLPPAAFERRFRPEANPGGPQHASTRRYPLRPNLTPSERRDARARPGSAAGRAAAALALAALLGAGFAPRVARAEGTPGDSGAVAHGPSAVYVPADTGAAAHGPVSAYVPSHVLAPADTTPPAVEYLWVVRGTLVEPGDIPRLVERAKAMRVRGLLVQVVGRGDAWYRSDLLPPPEALADPGRDPLGELLPLAHAAGLEVHAWMNCCLVWSAERPPRSMRHVVHEHPEWVARMRDGRPMTRLTMRERQRLRVEGVFLSPAHPAVRSWLANIAKEIVSRYDVDGLHLDYIRQPGVAIGYDPTSRAQFALVAGADPLAFDRLPPAERTRMDSAWASFQQSQVTAIVREVRDSVNAVRPGLPLSAAVLADTAVALRTNRQAWSGWLRDGLLDRAFAMCYAPPVQTVLGQLAAMSEQVGTQQIVPGIAVYNTPPATAAAKIKGARALGFPAVALYSYDSLWDRGDRWSRLLALVNGPRSPLEATP